MLALCTDGFPIRRSLALKCSHATEACEADQANYAHNECSHLFNAPAWNVDGRYQLILAEGAIALSVTLSGGALFAS